MPGDTMTRTARIALATIAAAFLAVASQTAIANDSPGKGKGKGNAAHGRSEGPGGGPYISVEVNFPDQDRRVIHDYYGDMARQGKCPPGLAKKQNGCLPPGQAKKWQVGRPLPRDVVFHPIPHDLAVRIAVPPAGYKYVRVASDILMIAAGTGMVAAAIEDLARL
jgi:hypothetical protein